jgi:hypothetical protein
MRLQACKDAAQLRRVLDARWQPDFRTLRIGGAGYEDETALHAKIRGSVVAAGSALRPSIADAQLTGLLYHCAAAAAGLAGQVLAARHDPGRSGWGTWCLGR